MIFLITSWNSAIRSPKSEKQCMFSVSTSRSIVGTKISLLFYIYPLPLHLPRIGFYQEQSDKEVRRKGRDSNGKTLIHVLYGQHSSEKYEFYPPPTIQKKEGFRGGKWDPNQLKENQVKWTLTRKTSYFLSLGEILPSVQAHVNSSLNFWIKSIFPHKY